MDQLRLIVESGQFERLLGLPEDAHLEVKSAPYDPDSVVDRFELAKDVSAFANAQGGYLLVGFSTAREPDAEIDTVRAITPLAEEEFQAKRCYGVILGYVYPPIQGLEVRWHALGAGGTGIGIVFVPRQHPDSGPFLVAKVVDDGAELKSVLVGYAERVGSSNEPLLQHKLQTAFRQGRDSNSQRLTRLEDKIDGLVQLLQLPEGAPPVDDARVNHRIEQILSDQG